MMNNFKYWQAISAYSWILVFQLSIALAGIVPDTGQKTSYTDTFGEDSDYTINAPSFTKLNVNGNDLAEDAADWIMVRDNISGLVWEIKSNDASIHNKSHMYSWDSAQNEHIAELNTIQFGGFSDWRLPSIKELSFLIDADRQYPAVNNTFFPDIQNGFYWSSTSHADINDLAWGVSFDLGRVYQVSKLNSGYVIAVRGPPHTRILIHNNDGTITDTSTGLMWQQTTDEPMEWETAIQYSENQSHAGYRDWRLPNIHELQSLVNFNRWEPALEQSFFPDMDSFSNYWSSTSKKGNTDRAWYVSFQDGKKLESTKSTKHFVRPVRGGQKTQKNHLKIDTPGQSDRWHIGETRIIEWNTAQLTDNLMISLSRHGGKEGSFEIISESVQNIGKFSWSVTGPESFNCMLKIEPINHPEKGTTGGLFSICTLHNAWINSKYVQKDPSTQELSLLGMYTDGIIPVNANWSISDASTAIMNNTTLTGIQNGWVKVSTVFMKNSYEKWLPLFISANHLENESNNTNDSATSMDDTSIYRGGFYQNDIDYYQFTLDSKAALYLNYFSYSAMADMDIHVVDSNDTLLASGTSIDGESLDLPVGLYSGTYYIKISSAGDVDQKNYYLLSVKRIHSLPEKSDTPLQLNIGDPQQQIIENLEDKAEFMFTLQEKKAINITFIPSGGLGRYHIDLLDHEHNVLESIDCVDNKRVSTHIKLSPNNYFLNVTPIERIDALHHFIIELTESSDQLEEEPNNSYDQATPFLPERPVQGQLQHTDDVDYFRFTVLSPQYWETTFSCPGSDKDFLLTLYKDSNTNVIDGITALKGQAVSVHMGLGIGTYYYKITTNRLFTETNHFYTLKMNHSSKKHLEIEPNNSLKFANAIEKNQPVMGRIYSDSDIDYYGFHLNEASLFSVAFTPTSFVGDYKISLLDNEGNIIDLRISENGEMQSIEADKPPDTYYIQIKSHGDIDSHRPYELCVSNGLISGLKRLMRIQITRRHQNMVVGENQQLTATAIYSDASSEIIDNPLWQSLDESIAFVDESGKLTAVSDGWTLVVASHNGLTGKCRISVGDEIPTVAQHYGNLILVAGAMFQSHLTQKSIHYLADLVYKRFTHRLFLDQDIYYYTHYTWHDIDGDGYDDNVVDDHTPTVLEFAQSITEWAVNQDTDGPLYIYLIDHGGNDIFYLSPEQILEASDLKTYLDIFQNQTGRQVIVVIESGKSGTFVDDIVSLGENRIIVTCTDDQDSYMAKNGLISFTKFFIDSLFAGDSIYKAWLTASAQLEETFNWIDPLLEQGSRLLAYRSFLGGNYRVDDIMSTITDQSPDQIIHRQSKPDFFINISNAERIEDVWAIVVPPDYHPEATEEIVPDFKLSDPDRDSRYIGAYDQFNSKGDYKITFYAINNNGSLSVSTKPTIVTVSDIGDFSGDGKIGLADAIMVLQMNSGKIFSENKVMTEIDIDKNSKIGIEEAIFIINYLAMKKME
jgi:hypothetical protein